MSDVEGTLGAGTTPARAVLDAALDAYASAPRKEFTSLLLRHWASCPSTLNPDQTALLDRIADAPFKKTAVISGMYLRSMDSQTQDRALASTIGPTRAIVRFLSTGVLDRRYLPRIVGQVPLDEAATVLTSALVGRQALDGIVDFESVDSTSQGRVYRDDPLTAWKALAEQAILTRLSQLDPGDAQFEDWLFTALSPQVTAAWKVRNLVMANPNLHSDLADRLDADTFSRCWAFARSPHLNDTQVVRLAHLALDSLAATRQLDVTSKGSHATYPLALSAVQAAVSARGLTVPGFAAALARAKSHSGRVPTAAWFPPCDVDADILTSYDPPPISRGLRLDAAFALAAHPASLPQDTLGYAASDFNRVVDLLLLGLEAGRLDFWNLLPYALSCAAPRQVRPDLNSRWAHLNRVIASDPVHITHINAALTACSQGQLTALARQEWPLVRRRAHTVFATTLVRAKNSSYAFTALAQPPAQPPVRGSRTAAPIQLRLALATSVVSTISRFRLLVALAPEFTDVDATLAFIAQASELDDAELNVFASLAPTWTGTLPELASVAKSVLATPVP